MSEKNVLGESLLEKLGSFENNQERSSCESCIEVNQVSERADDAEADADADAEADAEAEADADADAENVEDAENISKSYSNWNGHNSRCLQGKNDVKIESDLFNENKKGEGGGYLCTSSSQAKKEEMNAKCFHKSDDNGSGKSSLSNKSENCLVGDSESCLVENESCLAESSFSNKSDSCLAESSLSNKSESCLAEIYLSNKSESCLAEIYLSNKSESCLANVGESDNESFLSCRSNSECSYYRFSTEF